MNDSEHPKSAFTPGGDRRRDRRIPYRLRAVFCTARRDFPGEIEDVSYRGLLVRTDAPLSVRQLVRLRIALPPDGHELNTMGMVTRCVARNGGASPGVGIQFYAVSQEQRERWNRFIRFAGAEGQPAITPAAPSPRQQPSPTPLQYARHTAAVQVRRAC